MTIPRWMCYGLWMFGIVFIADALPYRPDLLPGLPRTSEPGMKGDICNTCHTNGGGTYPLTPFGNDWLALYDGARDINLTPAQAFAPVAEKDSDGDGFTNSVELQFGFHPGNRDSKPASGPVNVTRRLNAGLNAVSVPGRSKPTFRALDLLSMLGNEAEFLVRWNVGAGRFVVVNRSTPAGSADNAVVDGQTAFLVQMNAPKTVEFSGIAWDNSRVTLNRGLNFVALPTRPAQPARLDALLGGEGFGVSLSDDGTRFAAYFAASPTASPVNVPLLGGFGYFVFSPMTRTVDLGGVGWKDE